MSLTYLSPWWHIINTQSNESGIISLTPVDCIGHDENHFMILLEFTGLTIYQKNGVYVVSENLWNMLFGEYKLNNEITKFRNENVSYQKDYYCIYICGE